MSEGRERGVDFLFLFSKKRKWKGRLVLVLF